MSGEFVVKTATPWKHNEMRSAMDGGADMGEAELKQESAELAWRRGYSFAKREAIAMVRKRASEYTTNGVTWCALTRLADRMDAEP